MLDEGSHSFLGVGAQPWVSCSSAQELRAAVQVGQPHLFLEVGLPCQLTGRGWRAAVFIFLLPFVWGLHPAPGGSGQQPTCPFPFFPAVSASSPSRKPPLKRSPPPLTPGQSPCGHRWPLTAVRSPLSPGPPGCAHQAIGAPENPANHRGEGGVRMKGETEGQRKGQLGGSALSPFQPENHPPQPRRPRQGPS